MKKQWKSALFAVLLSTVLFSCGSGESDDLTKEERKQIEMEEHLIDWDIKENVVEHRFDKLDNPEAYNKAIEEVNQWHDAWIIEYDKKYN